MTHHGGAGSVIGALGMLIAAAAVLGYLRCVRINRNGAWPRWRTACWLGGVGLAYASMLLLVASGSMRPQAHMLGHLGLGMAAPVLLVLAAPLTLVLRTVPVSAGRVLVRIVHVRGVRVAVEPGVAAVLDVGGLWVLYATPLLATAHGTGWVAALVCVHLLAAGYLFTAAMISTEPLPGRRSVGHRAVVLVIALAAHGILAKLLYARAGSIADERAAMIMYYGGDVIEIGLLIALGLVWWRTRRPSLVIGPEAVGR